MGVYIDMEMPKDKAVAVVIHPDGTAYTAEMSAGVCTEYLADCTAVPVPPHYDLIDHNALKIAVMNGDCETRIDFLKHTMDCINKAPVVIPSDMPTYEAEEGE